MFEKFKDFLYSISDFLLTFVIILIIVVSISFVMTKSFNIDFSKGNLLSVETGEKKSSLESSKKDDNLPGVNIIGSETNEGTETNTTSTSITTPVETSSDNLKPKSEESTKPVVTQTNDVEISVDEGDYPGIVADKLFESGVIKSKGAFLDKIIEKKLEGSLQLGKYKFNRNMTIDEVIDVLFK